MKTKNIKIQEKEYKLKIGFGVMMLFEEEENKPITEASTKGDIMKLAYWTLKYNNEDFDFTYKYFVDEILDNNPAVFIDLVDSITALLFAKGEKSEVKKK